MVVVTITARAKDCRFSEIEFSAFNFCYTGGNKTVVDFQVALCRNGDYTVPYISLSVKVEESVVCRVYRALFVSLNFVLERESTITGERVFDFYFLVSRETEAFRGEKGKGAGRLCLLHYIPLLESVVS